MINLIDLPGKLPSSQLLKCVAPKIGADNMVHYPPSWVLDSSTILESKYNVAER